MGSDVDNDTTPSVRFVNLLGQTITMSRLHLSNHRWPRHFHSYFVFATPFSGIGHFRTLRGHHSARFGDLMLFNPAEAHDGGTDDREAWDYLSLHLSVETMQSLFSIVFDKPAPEIIFPRSSIADSEVAFRLRRFYGAIQQCFDPAELGIYLIQTAAALFSRHLGVNMTMQISNPPALSLARAADYMHANYARNISIQDLAQISGLNEHYFIVAFRKHYGISPHAYLNQVRLDMAAGEIRRGTSIIEAATLAGFYDQSHFHRHFRRMHCVTPGQYRTAARKRRQVSVSVREVLQ